MRYFRIYADERNVRPRILGWNALVKPGRRTDKQIYADLGKRNRLKVELDGEIRFMDLIDSPCFMVSRDFADLIRLYCPEVCFKYMVLFDERNTRTVSYQIPDLPEIDCPDADREANRGGKWMEEIVLPEKKIAGRHLFRLKCAEGSCIAADLEFVESAYRREVMGMGIRELVVR